MPGFDRTGPRGQGSRTGGGFGYCGSGAQPGPVQDTAAYGPVGAVGAGWGRGRGGGRGRFCRRRTAPMGQRGGYGPGGGWRGGSGW